MNAKQLLALQFISLITMFATCDGLFASRIATIIFAIAFFVFARCSIYISKHSARLLKELDREKEFHKVKG